MANLFKSFKQTAFYTLSYAVSVVVFGSATAYAAPTILVDPYDNLPVAGASALTVSGAGLIPGATVNILQVATQGSTTGVAIERSHKGSVLVDSTGNFQTTVSVTYDVRSDGVNTIITECNNRDSTLVTRQSCYLEVFYTENFGTAERTIAFQKLYFGMADPNKVIPPPVTVQPVSKDDCRDDKWGSFTAFGFKNQGACVSFVAKDL